ncbi:hypothetical protein [Deinococcus multiflagellatus]|uniref:hypothetical protein n=1 Tax=Deinococcus multiflagellatus TaxID=1656887 RepID=UPI001CCEE5DA|nr:hypothetical protein [Deinococcus multiflagellatus]MBZ9711675.1 hypothetical protein [Deinococcus multiflagellatus]
MKPLSRPALLVPMLTAGLLSSCLPATTGPRMDNLRTVPDAAWQPLDLLTQSALPASRVLPLEDAARRAPVGSLIVGCQRVRAVYGECTHITRKVSEAALSEETGPIGIGAQLRPLESLNSRDLILVIDSGVRPQHWAAMNAEIARLQGAPYLLGGQENAFDCATYQNALQRAMGLPEAVPYDPIWRAYLPLGALNAPGNTLLWAGIGAGVLPQGPGMP